MFSYLSDMDKNGLQSESKAIWIFQVGVSRVSERIAMMLDDVLSLSTVSMLWKCMILT